MISKLLILFQGNTAHTAVSANRVCMGVCMACACPYMTSIPTVPRTSPHGVRIAS
jgi:hypothetical protein